MMLVIFLLPLLSGMVVKEVRFNEYHLDIAKSGIFDRVSYKGAELTSEPGAPQLPLMNIKIALPYGARVNSVEVLAVKVKELPGRFDIPWAQPPAILSQREIKKVVGPKTEIYQSDRPYPQKIVQYRGSGLYDNHTICELILHPLQYYPASKRLVIYTSVQFAVHYEGGINLPAKAKTIQQLVINPEHIMTKAESKTKEEFKYLIITNPPMDTIFQRLADWKTKKGIRTKIRTVSWIISNFPGEDNPSKIRNYLKTLPDSSVEYVLLAGDTDIIPCRFAYAMDCSAGIYPGREDTMPCDLYYADLQGNWNFDNDGSYGEIEDSIDLYPDLFLGRAPVNTIAESRKFVEKVLTYEKSPASDYLDNALFAAEILWFDPYTDQAIQKDRLGNEAFPPYYELTKLYESLGNQTKASVMAAIRAGQNLINHGGHGWIQLISVGGFPDYIYSVDFDTITNTPRFGTLFSIGCWTAAFDSASVAEAFVNSPNGGGVAYIGNSSYGWGSPGNPGFGYSDRFDSRFFYSLFKENNLHLGKALALSKAYFIPYSREENVYRWHQYQLNLLGDPEMPVWTAIPETLLVFHPTSIPQASTNILITVKERNSNAPIKNALVCLMKGQESYSAGYTDASGSIFLQANAATSGEFDLTVSGPNYLPKEIIIPVTTGSYVNFQAWLINDLFGNRDGIANPHENILLPVRIKNCGNMVASNIHLRLRTGDPLATIIDSTASLSLLEPGDSITIDNAFALSIGSAPNGYGISFTLEITDEHRTLNFYPVILVGTPGLAIEQEIIVSPPCLPGQVESLYINLENSGYGFGHSTRAQLLSQDPNVWVMLDSVRYGEIPPQSIKIAPEPFVFYISPFCPSSYLARLLLSITTENYIFRDTVFLLIGETGFADDMESGPGLWTTGGTANLWHISTKRSFSPTHSWYCGDSLSNKYNDGMNCYIQTVPFMVQKNSLLRFYRWFSLPIYGTDGIYVIIVRGSKADTLDFIGAGGALDGRPIQSDWFEEKYSLFQCAAGETIQVRIAFISDNDGMTGEGCYIDDVNIEYITVIEETEGRAMACAQRLSVYPNPFSKQTKICFSIAQSAEGKERTLSPTALGPSLKIYDATGRLIKDFSRFTNYDLRSTSIVWQGDDDLGRLVPAGVYFVQLEVGDYKIIEKVILLR